jgi:anti-anti-sigma regulatory factor
VTRCLGTLQDLMGQLKPGFILLVDMSNLESMDGSCAQELGAIMDLCRMRGVSTVVRVIPDPSKDIGFNILSHFHYHPQVKTRTHATLAEAIGSLLTEPLETTSGDMTQ